MAGNRGAYGTTVWPRQFRVLIHNAGAVMASTASLNNCGHGSHNPSDGLLLPFGFSPAGEPHALYSFSKRAIDIVISVALIALTSPAIVIASIAIIATTGDSPLYIQKRVGLCGEEFRMIKLRTMRAGMSGVIPKNLNETSGPTFKSKTDPRVTPVGHWLRRTSLDETPQLINVLLGHMSLVGPRPALASEVREYRPGQMARLRVKPGLTCIWQVEGRSAIPFHTWMAMDRLYVRRRSLRLDLLLILRTPLAVVALRGAW